MSYYRSRLGTPSLSNPFCVDAPSSFPQRSLLIPTCHVTLRHWLNYPSLSSVSICLEGKPCLAHFPVTVLGVWHMVYGESANGARIFRVPPGRPQPLEVRPAPCLQGPGALQLRRNFLGAGSAEWPCFPRQPAFSFSTHFSFAVLGPATFAICRLSLPSWSQPY